MYELYVYLKVFRIFFSGTTPVFIMHGYIVIVILGFLVIFTDAGEFKVNIKGTYKHRRSRRGGGGGGGGGGKGGCSSPPPPAQ